MSCQKFSNLYKRVHLIRVARLIDSPWIPKQKENTFHSLGITFECLLNGGRGRTSLKELGFGSERREELNTHTSDTDKLHILLWEILTEYCMCYVPSFRKPHLPEKETGGTGLETILQKSKTKTTTTTKAHKISKFELMHHVLVTDYFPAEWRPDLGSRRRRRAHARKAREGNGNRSFPKRAFFSTIGQLQTFDAPKRLLLVNENFKTQTALIWPINAPKYFRRPNRHCKWPMKMPSDFRRPNRHDSTLAAKIWSEINVFSSEIFNNNYHDNLTTDIFCQLLFLLQTRDL